MRTPVSVLFDKKKYSLLEAFKWLDDHNLVPIKPVHETDNYLRFRIQNPVLFHNLKTFTLRNHGIKIIYGDPSFNNYLNY